MGARLYNSARIVNDGLHDSRVRRRMISTNGCIMQSDATDNYAVLPGLTVRPDAMSADADRLPWPLAGMMIAVLGGACWAPIIAIAWLVVG